MGSDEGGTGRGSRSSGLAVAHLRGGDAQIPGGGCQTAMPEQQLNRAHVGPGFQEMDREGVPERMGCDRFWNTRPATRLLAFASDGATTDRMVGLIAWKEPACGSAQAPPVTQHVEQLGRQHHVTIFEALPLLDADHHSVAVDIGRSQVERFRDTQAGGIVTGRSRGFFGAGIRSSNDQRFLSVTL